MHSPLSEVARWQLPADAAATEQFGARLGAHLVAGDTVALVGDLGAGKTTLARGLARGLGVDDPDGVASPTYLLVVEHPGRVRLLHADAYLPAKLAGFLRDGGLEYLFADDAVAVVEWADRIPAALPERALWLELTPVPDGGRLLVLRTRRTEPLPWLAQLGEFPPRR